MKLISMSAGVVLLFAFVAGTYYLTRQKTEPSVHYHAGFLVYVDGIKQDYTDVKYMYILECSPQSQTDNPENEQIGKAHLHSGVGDVVHVHREGAVWGDLLTNLGVPVPSGIKIRGYVAGIRVEDMLSYPIQPYDSVILMIGDTISADTLTYITRAHIEETEKLVETCGTNE